VSDAEAPIVGARRDDRTVDDHRLGAGYLSVSVNQAPCFFPRAEEDNCLRNTSAPAPRNGSRRRSFLGATYPWSPFGAGKRWLSLVTTRVVIVQPDSLKVVSSNPPPAIILICARPATAMRLGCLRSADRRGCRRVLCAIQPAPGRSRARDGFPGSGSGSSRRLRRHRGLLYRLNAAARPVGDIPRRDWDGSVVPTGQRWLAVRRHR
jgi:hypothetical protein